MRVYGIPESCQDGLCGCTARAVRVNTILLSSSFGEVKALYRCIRPRRNIVSCFVRGLANVGGDRIGGTPGLRRMLLRVVS